MKIARRTLLRSTGVAIALPFLDVFQGDRSLAACVDTEHYPAADDKRRFIAINVGLGLHAPNFIPESSGRDYALPPYLKSLGSLRDRFTLISGASHPSVDGGHHSSKSFLTCAPHPGNAGFRNSISLDQFLAQRMGSATRFASVSLTEIGPGLSWSQSGVEIPSESRPSRLFQRMFLAGNAKEQAIQMEKIRGGRSVLDAVLARTQSLDSLVSGRDKEKLDQYFSAVREAEQRLAKDEDWQTKPRPKVDAKIPQDVPETTRIAERMTLMYDMMHLALESDSTRLLTYFINGFNQVPQIPGVVIDYHNLSHHGKDPEKLAQLAIIEQRLVDCLAGFLKKLSESQEDSGSLLDRTTVLFGSNLGNASSHDTKNMPILLAGGDFSHGQHLAFDANNNYPLPNLFVSILQQMGVETDSFGSSKGTMTGLEH